MNVKRQIQEISNFDNTAKRQEQPHTRTQQSLRKRENKSLKEEEEEEQQQ